MSYHLGDFALETTVYAKFCTVTTTGAPTVLAGSPVVSVYENDDNTQITAGVTLNVDEDGVVGLNQLVIAATAANGYEVGKFYTAVITTGTVGGTSVVGYCVASFTIEATAALRPTTNGRELDVSAGGEAGLDWANIGSPTTAQNLSATNIDVDQIVASVSGAVGSVTGAVGSVTGNVGGNVVGSVASVTTVNGLAAGVITAASIATGAIDADALAADAVDEIWDEQIGDGTITSRQAFRVVLAALAAKLSGAATTTVTIRNVADSANVIVATVDSDGNRSATTVTP
jgi:hypothetical protein